MPVRPSRVYPLLASLFVLLLAAACSAGRPAALSLVEPPPRFFTNGQAATHYFLEGVRVINIYGFPDEAERCFRQAVALDSTHSGAWYELAGVMPVSKKAEALEYSRRAVTLEPDNVWYQLLLARLLIRGGQYDDALGVYRRLVELDPNNPENYKYLAALYEEKEQYFTAISVLDSAEVKFGMIEGLSSYKRQLLMNVGLTNRAIDEARALVDHFPYEEENYVVLGDLYGATGKDSLALEAYDHALQLDPNSVSTLASLTEFYRRRDDRANLLTTAQKLFVQNGLSNYAKIRFFDNVVGNPDYYQSNYFGVDELARSLALTYPTDPQVMDFYGKHLLNSGRVEDALKAYKGMVNDSTKLDVYTTILDIEAYLGHSDSVMRYSEIALDRFPKDPELYMKKGFALFYLKQYKPAEKELRAALKYATTDSLRSTIYSSLGDMAHSEDSLNTKKYYPLYEKAIRIYPNNVFALNNLSYYLSLEGKRLDEALAMSERVSKLDPNNATYMDTHAWVLYKIGRYEEARKILQQALSLDKSESAELMCHYGDILYELKDHFMASVYWKKARDKGYNPAEIDRRLKLIEGK
ncbi:MAG: tetratricopeptide repeat protein [Rikenellaceae bacterium]|jgi:tetratricopeptide (TPR) repeat protein|nr:tetratricopeptide repeat protein [Rikenellaceae bacterium]